VSQPYDATGKELIETDPAGWVEFLGAAAPAWAVRLVDSELSTVTTEADKVIRVDTPYRWFLHIDIQTGSDATLERRLLRYNALLHARHGAPVATVVVLLRKAADMKWLSGCVALAPPVGPSWEFRYQVIRVWERPVADFLTGPLGLVPLAPLADVTEQELPTVVADLKRRIDAHPERALNATLWAATYLLMGLRYDEALINNVLSGVRQMEESVTYQALVRRGLQEGRAEGRAEEARAILRLQGNHKFGAPSAEQDAVLGALTDPSRLESLCRKLLDVNTWDDLLAGV
jgi:predicted transposase YdaD